jgi:prepilin-type N-terminal cleavage/methylation domain-containing protein
MTPKRPLATALQLASRRRSTAAGFSLTELLVTLALGAVLAATAATTVITNIRTASNLELRQRAVDDFSRLNLFLQSEVSEGERIEYNSSSLPKDCGEGQPLFTIVLPNPLNPAEPPAERLQEPLPRIYYFTRNGGADLWRCGPSFDVDSGELLIASESKLLDITPTRVNADTRVSIVNTDDDRLLQYTLELRSRAGTITLQRGSRDAPLVARTGVRAIE